MPRRDVDRSLANRFLSHSEQALFLTMTDADQRHSLELCARLLGDGHAEPDLCRGALLHDVGKSTGPLPLVFRVTYALAAHLWPGLARRLTDAPEASWRRPFYIAANHAEIGAGLAERASSPPRVVALIRAHESPGNDELSKLLYDYDSSM
ncbi:MAG TPA: hypothetical protein VFZ25_21995 [Chloroflexota bacterium]|nr:hypothetical protein [Chloroflexota bacterium]